MPKQCWIATDFVRQIVTEEVPLLTWIKHHEGCVVRCSVSPEKFMILEIVVVGESRHRERHYEPVASRGQA